MREGEGGIDPGRELIVEREVGVDSEREFIGEGEVGVGPGRGRIEKRNVESNLE
jgi:hypothetical protein